MHRFIKLNQKVFLKSYIEIKIELKTKRKNDFKKNFFKLMNSSVFGKILDNVRKQRGIKLAATEKRRNYLMSHPNYHSTKFFTENLKICW